MKETKTKKIFLIVTALTVILILNSCGETSVEPQPQPGRRDYVWTVDTIDYPFDSFVSIWGSSPTDVWAGGFQPNDLYHFNGVKWEKWKENINSTCEALWGLSNTNIWMGGGDGKIWHYDGSQWKENFVYKNKNYPYSAILGFYGSASNDIYAVGLLSPRTSDTQRGFVLHYDGYQWKEIYVANSQSQFFRIRKQGNKYYVNNLTVNNTTGNDSVAFYEYDGRAFKNIFAKPLTEITWGIFNTIGDKLYFLITKDVYNYQNDAFVKRFSLSIADFGYSIYGRSEKDLFVRMKNGLAHYNGTNIEYLYRFDNNWTSVSSEAVIFEREVFFTVNDPINNKDFILHGKLKE